MNKKFSRFFLVFFMAIVILFDKVQVVKAAPYGLVLTLYSNSNNKKDMGHAWIGITNNTKSVAHIGTYLIKQGESVYIDARGEGDRPFFILQTDHKGSFNGGTFINYVGVASSVYKSFAYVSKEISFEDLNMIFCKMKNYQSYDLIANNCTHFAKSIWNGVKNKSKSIKQSFTGIEAPQSLKKYIVDKMGGKTGTTLNSASCYYFVSPLGHLVPSKIADVSSFQGKRNGSKASFSWQKPQTDQYDITGYEIKYVGNKSKKEKSIKVSSNSTSTSITGLNTYENYTFQIRAVCDYSSEGNGVYNYGDFSSPITLKGKSVKITLNKTKTSVTAGSSFTLKATVSGTSQKVTWSSSNSKVAKVKNGKVTGVKAGTAKITASVGGKKVVCTVTVKKKISTEVSAYNNFLKKGYFTTSYSYTVNGHKYTNKNQMVIASFSYVDTNGDRKPELYVRAYKKGDNPSYATDYLISYKNKKCVPVGLEEKLTGYFQGTNVKVSVSYAYLYNRPSTPYTKDMTYLYKTQRAYTTQQYLSSGNTVYRKFTTSFTAEMRTASEFYSWYRNYANNGRNYHSFVFYSSTASNLNKIIK